MSRTGANNKEHIAAKNNVRAASAGRCNSAPTWRPLQRRRLRRNNNTHLSYWARQWRRHLQRAGRRQPSRTCSARPDCGRQQSAGCSRAGNGPAMHWDRTSASSSGARAVRRLRVSPRRCLSVRLCVCASLFSRVSLRCECSEWRRAACSGELKSAPLGAKSQRSRPMCIFRHRVSQSLSASGQGWHCDSHADGICAPASPATFACMRVVLPRKAITKP